MISSFLSGGYKVFQSVNSSLARGFSINIVLMSISVDHRQYFLLIRDLLCLSQSVVQWNFFQNNTYDRNWLLRKECSKDHFLLAFLANFGRKGMGSDFQNMLERRVHFSIFLIITSITPALSYTVLFRTFISPSRSRLWNLKITRQLCCFHDFSFD